jgi:hypothetical protein
MTKHSNLYECLDALELYETWLVKEMPPGSDVKRAANNYNNGRKKTRSHVSYHTVADGFLFVRVK